MALSSTRAISGELAPYAPSDTAGSRAISGVRATFEATELRSQNWSRPARIAGAPTKRAEYGLGVFIHALAATAGAVPCGATCPATTEARISARLVATCSR